LQKIATKPQCDILGAKAALCAHFNAFGYKSNAVPKRIIGLLMLLYTPLGRKSNFMKRNG
jgi:hypothetical protein